MPQEAAASIGLEGIALALMEREGTLVERIEPGVATALGSAEASWPAPNSLATACFDPEALPEHPGAEPIVFGSPAADRLLSSGRSRDRVGRACVALAPKAPRSMPAEILRCLTVGATEIIVEEAWSRTDAAFLFTFHASFTGDEREEELYPLALDAATGRGARRLAERLESLPLADEPPFDFPAGPRKPVSELYARARREALAMVGASLRRRQTEQRGRLEAEARRMEAYFAETLEDIAERRARARPDQAAKYDGQQRATEAEMERQRREMSRRAVIAAELKLATLLAVHVPRTAARVRLRSRRAESRPLTLLWDPVEECVLPPDCPACSLPTRTLTLDDRGRVWCEACGGKGRL